MPICPPALQICALNLAARDADIALHLTKVAAGLDVHGVVPDHLIEREGMFADRQQAVDRWEVGSELFLQLVTRDIGRQPADSVIVADHDLEAAPAIFSRSCVLSHELGARIVGMEHRERMELASGDIRRRVGRQSSRVDGDWKARFLREARRRQAHDPRAKHRHRPGMALKSQIGRQLRASPAQGDSTAAVAVIVDQPFLTELLGADDEARAAVGAQSRDRPDHPALVDQHRRQGRAGRERSRAGAHGGAPPEKGGGTGGERAAIEQHRPTLASRRFRESLDSRRQPFPPSAGHW